LLGTIVAAGIVAAVAMVSAASVSAAGGSASHMSVDPIISPAGTVDPGYGLFSCQVGLSVGACYDPYQMRNAYGIAPLIAAGNTGKGETIVILDAFQSPNIVQQLNFYDNFYGLPGLNGLGNPSDPNLGTFTQIAPQGLTPFVTGNAEMTGWAEEISLDVLWAHAIAPGANIVLDLSTDSSDAALSSALKYVVDRNMGDVISQSFGESDTCDAAARDTWHSIYASATTKNMTIFASSGDQGAAQPSCDGSSWIKSTSSPASDPLVTGVGGTELNAAGYCLPQLGCVRANNPTFGTYLSEIAWNEGPPFGDFQANFGSTLASGGGFSTVWSEPSYQHGTIPSGKQRAVPDVAYSAAVLHGVLTYLNIPGIPAGFYRFGGTSAGSPQWAAVTAIADQAAGHDLGFINSALYHIGQAPPRYSAGFHDITSGTNSAVEFDSNNNPVTVLGYNAGAGWDAVTGLGSPIVNQLIPMLIQFTSPGDGVSAINDSKHG
jgi:subtilase family serine protease